MLRLVLSRASGGKTTYIHNRIKELVDCGCAGNIILLVPEQYSFATERMMLETLGAAGACGVEVLSFTRLANSVFSTLGHSGHGLLSALTAGAGGIISS